MDWIVHVGKELGVDGQGAMVRSAIPARMLLSAMWLYCGTNPLPISSQPQTWCCGAGSALEFCMFQIRARHWRRRSALASPSGSTESHTLLLAECLQAGQLPCAEVSDSPCQVRQVGRDLRCQVAGNCLLRLVAKLTELVGTSAPKTDLWARIRKDCLQVRLQHDSGQAESAAGTRCQHTLWLCQPMWAAACVPVSQCLTRAWVCAKQKQLTASSVMQRLCLGEFRPPTAWHDFLDPGMSLLASSQQGYKDPDDFPLPATVCPPPCCRSMVAGGSLQPGHVCKLGLALDLAAPPGSSCVAADHQVAGLVGGRLPAAPLACHAVAFQPSKRCACEWNLLWQRWGPPKVRTLHALACLMRQQDCRL